jgi:peptidoglycan glycosyltransferase
MAGITNPGSSVVLTINSQMQLICEQALVGRKGAIVILDPSTGAVLAKASAPTFDPNNVSEYMELSDSNGTLIDRATSTRYAPGSIYKVLTLAAALDANVAKLDDKYDAPATKRMGESDIVNFDDQGWDKLTLEDAFAYSANTVFGTLGTKLGATKLVNYSKAFGYGSDGIGQDFTTSKSLMPDPAEMTEGELAWAACGQPVGEHASPAGPQATVMQDAVMVATIANDGIAMNPYLVDHVLSPEGATVSSALPHSLGQPISAKTAKSVKEAMRVVVEKGTGWPAAVEGVQVAGKTGTAEVGPNTSNSLFVGFAPYDQPTLALAICIEGSEGEQMSGVAADISGWVIANCLNIQAQGA